MPCLKLSKPNSVYALYYKALIIGATCNATTVTAMFNTKSQVVICCLFAHGFTRAGVRRQGPKLTDL